MADFPLLNSGAVTQYPLTYGSGQGVQVIRFLDGSEQRFLTQGRQLRRWEIALGELTEEELTRVEQFFTGQLGDYSTFAFPDPIGGAMVLNCRIASPVLSQEWSGTDRGAVSFWVVETNG